MKYKLPKDYYKMSVNDLKELDFTILKSFFLDAAIDGNVTLEKFDMYNLTDFEFWEYGNILYDSITKIRELNKIPALKIDISDRLIFKFVSNLIVGGYNINLKYGADEQTFVHVILANNFDHANVLNLLESVFKYQYYFTFPFDVNAKDKHGNSIIHTAIMANYSCDDLLRLLFGIGLNFDIECKNNDNLNILEMYDRCTKGLKYRDCQEKEFKKTVNALMEFKRNNKLKKQNNTGMEEEAQRKYKKILFTVRSLSSIGNHLIGERINNYDKLSSIINYMEYLKSETNNKRVFSQGTIDYVKIAMIIGPNYWSDYFQYAVQKTILEAMDEDKRAKIVSDIKKIIEKIDEQSFEGIIENRNNIFSLKDTLEQVISSGKYLDLKENFDSIWSQCEEKLKQKIRMGIENLTVPIDSNIFRNILQALEEYEFQEEIEFLNKFKDKIKIVPVEKENSRNEQVVENLLNQALKLSGNNKEEILNKMKELIEKLSSSDNSINEEIVQKENNESMNENNSAIVTTTNKVKQKKKS